MTVLFVCLNSFENLDQTYNLSSLYGRSHDGDDLDDVAISILYLKEQCSQSGRRSRAAPGMGRSQWRQAERTLLTGGARVMSADTGSVATLDLQLSAVQHSCQLLNTYKEQSGALRELPHSKVMASFTHIRCGNKQQCVYALTGEPARCVYFIVNMKRICLNKNNGRSILSNLFDFHGYC